jgi:hypothetical protein
LFRNGTEIASDTTTAVATAVDYAIYIGGTNYINSLFGASDREYAFASIGAGLSPAEVTDYQAAVLAYQTSLGRQI